MLSYKQWKVINESILPSFNLGLGNPSNLGIQSPYMMDIEESKMSKKKKKKMDGDDDLVKPARDADMPKKPEDDEKPEVDVDVDEEGEDEDEEEQPKKSKELNDVLKGKDKKDNEEDEDKDEDDSDDEDEDEEDEDDSDEEDEDEDEDEKPKAGKDLNDVLNAKDSKMNTKEPMNQMYAKKKMLKGGQKKLDKDHDGKITGKDFEMMRAEKKHKKKKHAKEIQEEQNWWNSIHNMLGVDPGQKNDSGLSEYQASKLFTPIDTDNLSQAVRSEPGEPGFAPQNRIGW